VNNRRGLLRKGFLRRCERYTRLGFYFQGAAEFIDFIFNEQPVAALWQAFQR
jgi:hypothetical protein